MPGGGCNNRESTLVQVQSSSGNIMLDDLSCLGMLY